MNILKMLTRMDTINEFWKVNSDIKQHSWKLEKLNKRLTLLVLFNKTCCYLNTSYLNEYIY